MKTQIFWMTVKATNYLNNLFIALAFLICLLSFVQCNQSKLENKEENDSIGYIDSLLDQSFLYLREDLSSSLQLSLTADSLSRSTNYIKGLARSLRSQAYYNYYSNRPDEALELLEEADNLEKSIQNAKGLAATYNAKAWLYKKMNLYEDALEYYKKSMLLKDSSITYKSRISGQNNIANLYTKLVKYDSAVLYYNNALSLAEQEGDTSNLSKIFTNLGNTYSLLNNSIAAKEHFLKALEISIRENNKRLEAKIYNNLGALFYEIGEDSLAMDYYIKSIEVKQMMNDSLALAKSYFNIAELYSQSNSFSTVSEDYARLAKHIFQSVKSADNLSKVFLFQADKYAQKNQLFLARNELEKAEILLDSTSDLVIKSEVYKKLAEVLYNMGLHKEANEKYRQYDILNDSILNADKLWNVAEQEKKHLMKIKQNEISLLEKDKLIANVNAQKKQEENKKLLFSLGGAVVILMLLSLLIIYFYRLRKTESKLAIQQETLLKRELQNLVDEQELHIVNATLDARKKEKEVISKELHNNIGSLLTSAKFHFQSFNEDVLFSDTSTKNLYLKTSNIIDNIIDEIRSLSHRFDNDALPGFNLKNAVTEFLKKVDSKHLSVQTTIHGLDSFQNSEISIFIFRALQELVNNVLKHSKATQLIVYITRNMDGINIMVEDNGRGIDTNKKQEGIGLKNLNRQIEELNGECFIDSNPGRGTTININLPILEKV